MAPRLGPEYPHEELTKSQDLIHMNIYNQCFMDPDIFDSTGVSFRMLDKMFDGLDSRFYPYLSFNLPLFQHWTGHVFFGPEQISNKMDLDNEDGNDASADDHLLSLSEVTFEYDTLMLNNIPTSPSGIPFWNYYKTHLMHTGIVISINNDMVDDAILLVGNLRTLGNRLPIEIFHRGDLSNMNRLKLVKAARTKLQLDVPKQNIWFVDVSFALNSDYKDEFPKYFNKMLAYGFNSFVHTIMLDVDVVLFASPTAFLKTETYKDSGTLFFKDRNLNMNMRQSFMDFLQDTSPNKIDEFLFGMSAVNEDTWKGEYFKEHYFHYMESGVVAINRKSYWNGVIMSLHLSFIQSTYIGSWGDKEHFWMGLLLSGLDDYRFDRYWAASVGHIITQKNGIHKICSSHPSHILSETNELLWTNSGITNCPKLSEKTVMNDFNLLRQENSRSDGFENIGLMFGSSKELEGYYRSHISFEGFIIPPLAKYNLAESNEEGFEGSYVGLEQTHLCQGYMWCAYDQIGDGLKSDLHGTFMEFTDIQKQKYQYIAQQYLSLYSGVPN